MKSFSKKSKNNSKSFMHQQKRVIKQRIVHKTKYPLLIPNDSLYTQNMSTLTSSAQYLSLLQKILCDLNMLLYLNQQDFFQQLQTQDSLRLCLQSCLVCLPKKVFYKVTSSKKQTNQKIQQYNQNQKLRNNQYLNLYRKFIIIVLKVYYRISQAQTQIHKQIIYSTWLLDVPKMIDLAMIYVIDKGLNSDYQQDQQQQNRYTNLQIIRNIIQSTIKSNPKNYSRDVDDFINILYEKKIPSILHQIKIVINLSEPAMKKASVNFQNPLKSFLISASKILFSIKDIFVTMKYFYLCFPKNMRRKLATDHEIHEDLIRIVSQFIDNTQKWVIPQVHLKQKFQTNISQIKQKMVQTFSFTFRILYETVKQGDTLANDHYSRALSTYCVDCLYFTSNKVQKAYRKNYEKLIKTIMYQRIDHRQQPQQKQNSSQKLFFLQQAPINLKFIKLSDKQKEAIKQSYQKQISFIKSVKQQKLQDKQFQYHTTKVKQFFDKQFRLNLIQQKKIHFKYRNYKQQKLKNIEFKQTRFQQFLQNLNKYSQLNQIGLNQSMNLSFSYDYSQITTSKQQQLNKPTMETQKFQRQNQKLKLKNYLYEVLLSYLNYKQSTELQKFDDYDQINEQINENIHTRPQLLSTYTPPFQTLQTSQQQKYLQYWIRKKYIQYKSSRQTQNSVKNISKSKINSQQFNTQNSQKSIRQNSQKLNRQNSQKLIRQNRSKLINNQRSQNIKEQANMFKKVKQQKPARNIQPQRLLQWQFVEQNTINDISIIQDINTKIKVKTNKKLNIQIGQDQMSIVCTNVNAGQFQYNANADEFQQQLSLSHYLSFQDQQIDCYNNLDETLSGFIKYLTEQRIEQKYPNNYQFKPKQQQFKNDQINESGDLSFRYISKKAKNKDDTLNSMNSNSSRRIDYKQFIKINPSNQQQRSKYQLQKDQQNLSFSIN